VNRPGPPPRRRGTRRSELGCRRTLLGPGGETVTDPVFGGPVTAQIARLRALPQVASVVGFYDSAARRPRRTHP